MAHPLVLHGRSQYNPTVAQYQQQPARPLPHAAQANQSSAAYGHAGPPAYQSPTSYGSSSLSGNSYNQNGALVDDFSRLSVESDRVRYQLQDGVAPRASSVHGTSEAGPSRPMERVSMDGVRPYQNGNSSYDGVSAVPPLHPHSSSSIARPVSIPPPTPINAYQRHSDSAPLLSHRSLPQSQPPQQLSAPQHRAGIANSMDDPNMYRLPSSSSGSTASSGPPLVAFIPTIEYLFGMIPAVDTKNDRDKISFAQDVIRTLDRYLYPNGSATDFVTPETALAARSLPPQLEELLNVVIPIIISFTEHGMPTISAQATYLRGKLLASGACADFLPRDQRQAFRDFEVAARGGEARGWFRLGRDYEGVGDLGRARECFEKGRLKGDCECTYRMGMANLLGQLHLSPDPFAALPLLRQASDLTSVDFPQPSYVYGMLLAGELSTPTPIPPSLVLPNTSSPSESLLGQHKLAREAIERAAYLGLAPAQHKVGYLYEHASLDTPYDPLMSVQWYSLASQGGEIEADMALSKWFLCGAEGHFGKNEELARTFAEKAARKGHPNGCFAMGYYYELGIGGRQDRDQAKKWYQRAAKLDNSDAIQRLAALSAPTPQAMTRSEHQSRLNDTLVRRHTQAKIRSDRLSTRRPGPPRDSSRLAKSDAARINAAAQAAAHAHSMPVPTPAAYGTTSGSNGYHSSASFPRSPQPPSMHPPTAQPIFPASASTGHVAPPRSPHSRPARPHIDIPSSPSHNRVRPSPSMPMTTPPAHSGMSNGHSTPPPHRSAGGHSNPSSGQGLGQGPINLNSPAKSIQRGYILQDSLVPELPPPDALAGDPGPKKKGPQTFAEMGFVSKPVQDEGCCIM